MVFISIHKSKPFCQNWVIQDWFDKIEESDASLKCPRFARQYQLVHYCCLTVSRHCTVVNINKIVYWLVITCNWYKISSRNLSWFNITQNCLFLSAIRDGRPRTISTIYNLMREEQRQIQGHPCVQNCLVLCALLKS